MSEIDATFSALADPTRRRVVDLLRRRPRRAGEIAAALEMSAPATSRHLRILRKRGLIEEQPYDDDYRVRIYKLCPQPFGELREWLEEVERFWSEQLDSFKSHAEQGRPSDPS